MSLKKYGAPTALTAALALWSLACPATPARAGSLPDIRCHPPDRFDQR